MLAGISAPASAAGMDKVKACFIYVGPVGDFGWSYQHDQGRLYAEEKLGDKLETAYLESVPEGADAERAIERFARSGCNIIFTTSFGYMDATNKVAKDFPDVKFEHATGYKREHPNVSTYDSRFYEGRYVLGQIAAKMSKVGTAGYIASFPIPEVIQGINSFMLGAQSCRPGLQAQGHLVQHMVRPGQGSRCCQGTSRPGCGHSDPAHRFDRADAGCRRAWCLCLRPGIQHV